MESFGAENWSPRELLDSDGSEQSSEIKGVWVNKCWRTRVEKLAVSQSVGRTDERCSRYHLMIDETANDSYESTDNLLSIGELKVANLKRGDIAIGDPVFISPIFNVEVGRLSVASVLSGGSGAGLVCCNRTAMRSTISISEIVVDDSYKGGVVHVDESVSATLPV